jgi:predicted dinucleotide-binding enzyme
MKIGIVGTGNMGRALGLRWADGGYQVLFGSRTISVQVVKEPLS